MDKALGFKDVTNSVLAPMPCKILRVEVQAGDTVKQDQPLVVIESMKMETVIRSPQQGTISRVVHQQGDQCKSGTPLVEFAGESMPLRPFASTSSRFKSDDNNKKDDQNDPSKDPIESATMRAPEGASGQQEGQFARTDKEIVIPYPEDAYQPQQYT
ncbi:hypothetical protein LTS12_028969, partial [Elasticomyces elasticus]